MCLGFLGQDACVVEHVMVSVTFCSPEPTSLVFRIVCSCGLRSNPGVGGLTDL